MFELSPLQRERLGFKPEILPELIDLLTADFEDAIQPKQENKKSEEIKLHFPHLTHLADIILKKNELKKVAPLRVGVVLSGGQAAGGHNVISGLFDALSELNNESTLFGFLGGPLGIIKNSYCELTRDSLELFRNQGGFDLLGSGRDKIETQEQFASSLQCVQTLKLDGLVIIGGDDSNTNACHLAEFFLQHSCHTKVVGVPKTIDGDLQSDIIEIPFGFDTACKVYSETIGNIARDALSAKKYYYFIKLMGRSASHITLECALQVRPNLALIGEEIFEKKMTLAQVVAEISDLVAERAKQGKNYGVILIPEGIIEFLVDIRALISELNSLLLSDGLHSKKLNEMKTKAEKLAHIESLLHAQAKLTFTLCPEEIQLQLIQDRDPHGNVQVAKIETERLLQSLVEEELKKRKALGTYTGKFSAQPIFCGYEARCALPSNFDANYCYNLGRLAALLIARKKTGYMAAVTNLAKPVHSWRACGASLVQMMHCEERSGKVKVVLKKALVDLAGSPFHKFSQKRQGWRLDDSYSQSGPIQFFGPSEVVDAPPQTLLLKSYVL